MISYKQLAIPEVLLIEPRIFNDERGLFFESYNQNEFEKVSNRKVVFVQDNHSESSKGVLRGLHYQKPPFEQGKLVRVIQGEVWDVAVDLRKNSATYGKWVGEILSASNKNQLWIPDGFAHGFLTLEDDTHVLYKATSYYQPSSERSIRYDDEEISIDWPEMKRIVSNKDLMGISLKDISANL